MDQYQVQNTAFTVDGYYWPSPREGCDNPEGQRKCFERARQESILHLTNRLNDLKSITFEQYQQYSESCRLR